MEDVNTTVEALKKEALEYERQGMELKAKKDIKNAREVLLKLLDVRKQIAELTGTMLSYIDVANVYNTIGTLDYDPAMYEASWREWAKLSEKYPDEKFLAERCDNVHHLWKLVLRGETH